MSDRRHTLPAVGRLDRVASGARWLPWLAALVVVTVALLAGRAWLDKSHVALTYLLLVLVASSRAGRGPGLALATLAFFSLNFFFLPPYHTLMVAAPLDWLVLVAFLVTGAVAAQLLARAQSEADAARQRTREVDRLSAVGAEALNAGRAEEALAAIAGVIRTTLDVGRCEIYLRDAITGAVSLAAESGPSSFAVEVQSNTRLGSDDDVARRFSLPTGISLVEWVAANGRAVVERVDGAMRVTVTDDRGSATPPELDLSDARILFLPLRLGERVAGVLRLAGTSALAIDAPRRRFLEAMSYYASLGVERVRLVSAGEQADALRQADALKDALLASVSHDLRTPLTTIKALAHDIRMEGDDRAATIEEQADRLNRFVSDLLDLSRLTGGAFTVTPEVNAAEDLVGAALQQVSGTLNGRALEVHLDPAEPLLLGRFDFVHALRVLVNLIENALKYSPPHTPIELSVQRSADALEIIVADRGPGVSFAERGRIFEAFYRPRTVGAEGGTPADVEGAGLGLSIARQLATAQGGTLHHEPRDGGGSRFVLRLPVADVSEVRGTVPVPTFVKT